MNLDSLDSKGKALITTIVDAYLNSEKHIKAGTNQYFSDAGIQVDALFADFNGSDLCNVSFHKTSENDVSVCYTFSPNMIIPLPNEDEYDARDRYVNIERVIILYKISLLKWLYESNYIFLVDDKSWNLFNTGSITDNDKKKWEGHGIIYFLETLKSNTVFEVLSKFHNCRIIPSPELIYYRKNGYKTPEQLRFEEQQAISYSALERAKRANIIAISIAIVSMIVSILCATLIPVTIKDKQHNELIEILKTNIINGKTTNGKP